LKYFSRLWHGDKELKESSGTHGVEGMKPRVYIGQNTREKGTAQRSAEDLTMQ
jgi:hypothetical protein